MPHSNDSDEDDADTGKFPDPKSDVTLLLPSLFRDRPPTVWLDYAQFSNAKREEGKERFEAAQEEDKRSKRKRGEVAGVFAHYDPGEWEVETDYEEWDDAGFPFSVL